MKKYLSITLYIIVIILNIGLYAFMYYVFYLEEEKETIIEPIKEETSILNDIYVDIKGAVNTPGVYKLTTNNIINDVVSLAGGFNTNAYTNNINLSKKLTNEMVIYVYTKYEYSKLDEIKTVYVEKECNCPKYDISSCIKSGSSIITQDETTPEEPKKEESKEIVEETNTKININTASLEELTALNGIGESKAKAIISYRQTNGNFNDPKDIINVSGISENIYEKIKDNITV